MHPTLFAVFLSTYGGVFIAEIVGDKLLYTTGILASRYRIATVVIGVLFAFLAKMGVAVLVFAKVATMFPTWLVATITGLNFLILAIVLWRKPDFKPGSREKKKDHSTSQGIIASFAAVFFSEWGDKGMIACAALAVVWVGKMRETAPSLVHTTMLAVWLGSVAAMMTKGALAATAGDVVRRWVQNRVAPKTVRYVAVCLYLLLGVLSVLEIVGFMPD